MSLSKLSLHNRTFLPLKSTIYNAHGIRVSQCQSTVYGDSFKSKLVAVKSQVTFCLHCPMPSRPLVQYTVTHCELYSP